MLIYSAINEALIAAMPEIEENKGEWKATPNHKDGIGGGFSI